MAPSTACAAAQAPHVSSAAAWGAAKPPRRSSRTSVRRNLRGFSTTKQVWTRLPTPEKEGFFSFHDVKPRMKEVQNHHQKPSKVFCSFLDMAESQWIVTTRVLNIVRNVRMFPKAGNWNALQRQQSTSIVGPDKGPGCFKSKNVNVCVKTILMCNDFKIEIHLHSALWFVLTLRNLSECRIDKNTCDPHLQGLSNQRAQVELAAMPHRVMEVERRSKHIVIHKHIEAKSKAGANTSRVVSTCEKHQVAAKTHKKKAFAIYKKLPCWGSVVGLMVRNDKNLSRAEMWNIVIEWDSLELPRVGSLHTCLSWWWWWWRRRWWWWWWWWWWWSWWWWWLWWWQGQWRWKSGGWRWWRQHDHASFHVWELFTTIIRYSLKINEINLTEQTESGFLANLSCYFVMIYLTHASPKMT